MRFERLALERYGAFTERTLTFRPDARLHVILGPNEAGKTTALAAIGDLLFGFPERTSLDFAHEARTLRVGAHVRLRDGTALTFRRRKGRKNTILDADDQPFADDPLVALLGSVKRETFDKEFGLTAEALRRGGDELVRAGGRLAETIAASSAGLSALAHARQHLDQEAGELFAPRRSESRKFYVAADRQAEAERQLRDAIVTADALKAADDAVREAAARLDAVAIAHAATGRELARLQRAQRTRPRLMRLDALRAELAGFADLAEVPADAAAAWRRALADEARLGQQIAELDRDDAAEAASMDALRVDETLLAAGETIEALRERLGAARKSEQDLPRRSEARRAAHEALSDAARRLGLACADALSGALVSDAALARVRELIGSGKRAADRLGEADAALDLARRELERLARERPDDAQPIDPEPFRRRLQSFASVPADAERWRRDVALDETETKHLAEAAAALDPPAGPPERIAATPLPDEAAITAACRTAENLADELATCGRAAATTAKALATAEAEIAKLSRAGAVPTRDDLVAARRERDAALTRLAGHLDDAAARRQQLDAVTAADRTLDDTTDRLLADSERAALRQAAEERLQAARREQHDLAAERAAIETRRGEAARRWAALWAASGIPPHDPARMARWRERVGELLARRTRLGEKRAETEALGARLAELRDAIAALLGDLGRRPDAGTPAHLLHAEAQLAIVDLHQRWTDARERAVRLQKASEAVEIAEGQHARAREHMEQHRADWPSAVIAIGLRPDASLAEAEAALAVWQSVPALRHRFDDESHRVSAMERDLAAFDSDVTVLVASSAPDLAGCPAAEALGEIAARLAAARRARDERAHRRQTMAERARKRAALAAEREQASTILAQARRHMGTTADAPLALLIDRIDRRAAAAREVDDTLRDLADIADGHDEASLRAEQQGLDFDAVPAEIARLDVENRQTVIEFADATTRRHTAAQEYEALTRGRDSAGAARERTEAEAELLSIAERWLVRAAAVRLAARAIERHRAAVQDPLVERAGQFFALATATAFSGLGIDFDDQDNPVLVGVRQNGALLRVEQMSTGTRDQLYLALRLALLERRTAEPLPFVGDDLLASFDESRAARTLDLIADFGRDRQAILFTHHRHVGDIARERLGEAADVIEL